MYKIKKIIFDVFFEIDIPESFQNVDSIYNIEKVDENKVIKKVQAH